MNNRVANKKMKSKKKKKKSGDAADKSEAAPVAESAEELPKPVDDKLLRLQADFDNFRKRTVRDKDETYRRANESIMFELLPVLDHLELALAAVEEHGESSPVAEGFKLVSDQMVGVLSKFGLQPIDARGKEFDPDSQEAISRMPSPDVPMDVVVEQIRKGYRLGDRLLRAAQVVVSCGDGLDDKDGEE
jgi:molecular chaperone GrpE